MTLRKLSHIRFSSEKVDKFNGGRKLLFIFFFCCVYFSLSSVQSYLVHYTFLKSFFPSNSHVLQKKAGNLGAKTRADTTLLRSVVREKDKKKKRAKEVSTVYFNVTCRPQNSIPLSFLNTSSHSPSSAHLELISLFKTQVKKFSRSLSKTCLTVGHVDNA